MQEEFGRLREKVSAIASAIAETEERIACTLDNLASTRPQDAPRLRERAKQARLIAAKERQTAVEYGHGYGVHAPPT